MTDFFKSEMVRGDLQEMAELQQYCMRSMMTFPALSPERKVEYFEVLLTLIEKQKLFYTRLTLSDDEEAKEMLVSMKESAILLGASPSDNLLEMFDDLIFKVNKMRQTAEEEAQGA
ncbi:DUF1825 [Synechococcus phage S-PM2]|uniref:DUF1825 n=1 Tax=Synechococcus phage S-PM2 TaxID=238854 RepID=Q5GQD9_BPSYP|nr:DUF1825 [Synechococcus phage S-PM2]CAF34263.1 DUF1825 [Synechococcus phage S-PM2]CFW42413.1 DUF1825 [Synechococcus phage S-PM2]